MTVRGVSPSEAGIDLFPAVFLLVPGSIIVSILTSRLGRFRWAIWAGWAITTLGAGLLILDELNPKVVHWASALAVYGVGTGMVLTSVNVGIQAISKEEDAAMAACMYGFMRSLGMPIGVALSGTIFQNAMSSKLSSFGLPKAIAHDSERYVFVLRHMAPSDPTRLPILQSYSHGFRSVWIFMTAVSASALVVSFVIRRFDMNKTLVAKFSARQ
jgi:MFS family permease